MELALGRLSATGEASVLFTPHLVPMTRGILATCYARPTAEAAALGTDGLLAHYRDFYAGEPFVAVLDPRRPPRPPPAGTPCTSPSASTPAPTPSWPSPPRTTS